MVTSLLGFSSLTWKPSYVRAPDVYLYALAPLYSTSSSRHVLKELSRFLIERVLYTYYCIMISLCTDQWPMR